MPVAPLRHAELVALTPAGPRMPAQCHDCAFHKDGSPEQSCPSTWGAILRHVDRGEPFYCHAGMPMEGTAYKPEVDARGVPLAARVCAGWLEMRARFIAVRRADLVDDMRAAWAAQPVAFAVAALAVRVSAEMRR